MGYNLLTHHSHLISNLPGSPKLGYPVHYLKVIKGVTGLNLIKGDCIPPFWCPIV